MIHRTPIHIASASDQRYFPGLLGMVTSLLISTKSERPIHFHLIDGGIEEASWQFMEHKAQQIAPGCQIFRLQPDLSDFSQFPGFFFDSLLTYARLLLPELVDADRILYLDADILFLKEVETLFDTDLKGKAAAVAREPNWNFLKQDCPRWKEAGLDPLAPYFNSGLILMDLDTFRKQQISYKTLEWLRNFPEACKFHDQSALNAILHGNFRLLDGSWNTHAYHKTFPMTKFWKQLQRFDLNIHYITSYKPWLKYQEGPLSYLFYELLEQLGYNLFGPDLERERAAFKQKNRWAGLIASAYRQRAYLKQTAGDKDGARINSKVADFWKDQSVIKSFVNHHQREFHDWQQAWSEKITHKLTH
ncbi:MAG: glycosyltransferase family 8 protein [Bacteroidota bacterium]